MLRDSDKIEVLGNPQKHTVPLSELANFLVEHGGGGEVTVTIDQVAGVGTVGLQVAKAATAQAARTAIGAGTSNLAIGTTATTAKAGNWTPPNVTTAVNGLMLSTDKVKLDGIAVSATANDTDANLKNRANHTGTQPFSTISGTATAAQIPSLDAAKITSGTFAVARIPTGTTATTVALGNHTHSDLVALIDSLTTTVGLLTSRVEALEAASVTP